MISREYIEFIPFILLSIFVAWGFAIVTYLATGNSPRHMFKGWNKINWKLWTLMILFSAPILALYVYLVRKGILPYP